ncbi:Phenylalanine--tRNA ligase beta subunit [wastewater metagenome]|uniref:Phenylalanine--tRNA ligase beta subunit n=2 Tax=unclassified sequences TaxID=12908 RepID=A0A5B8RCL6_9ZZZZ|nr:MULTISPECIES: phenylalanine--tRNA ligase subunit beta [Arhodomonas]MCS4505692.1 phenylalanine--tRNA ligase subunit beta [Arhodomonas aquaeolei]QEA05843.1 phenylalanine--tRNA ligase beta subunit [uncultured organism]
MRISEQWLREWVTLPETTAELGHRLTMAGLEVDAVEPAAPPFTGLVVGEVVACEPHPDADRLSVCTVADGEDEQTVVCGAPNVRVGLKAPFARIGAVLPGDFRIRRTKLRGVASHGMLCSARELGLSEDAAGLMELPGSAPTGADLREYLGLDDTVIEVDLTPNRSDCLGMAGVAREVGVIGRCEVTDPAAGTVSPALTDSFPVRLDAPAACPRYLGRIVRGVDTAAETPVWMRERLRRAGVRPLSVAVDVTNYVMLELGQPMHAFDLATLRGGIHVRMAASGERLALLNGDTVTLDPETLVIADDERAVAMAGIMGGADTAVGEGTRDVFLEAAFFAPDAIAGRARAHGLHTDSSHRFERGVDPALPARAMERATALLTAIAGGEAGPAGEAVDEGALPVRPPVRLRPGRVNRLLGTDTPEAEMRDILERLGMAVAGEAHEWSVTPPTWRFDIAREEDLVEEIARIRGYDSIPVKRTPAPLAMSPQPETRLGLRRLRRALVDRDYQEAITYSFVARELDESLDPDSEALALANPLSEELAVMRTSLWPGLVRAAVYNQNRQSPRVRLFESGLRFRGSDGATLEQTPVLAGIATGNAAGEHWDGGSRPLDFFDIKGDVEALMALTGVPDSFTFEPAEHPALHPGQSARVLRDGRPAGWIGAIHPDLEGRLELAGRSYVFEIELAALDAARVPAFEPLSRYPSIRRDLAVVVDDDVAAGTLRRLIAESAGEWLRDLAVFDVYRGRGVPEGRKSLAIGLILQDSGRTLTDADVEGCIAGVIERLRTELNASLRE